MLSKLEEINLCSDKKLNKSDIGVLKGQKVQKKTKYIVIINYIWQKVLGCVPGYFKLQT